VRQASGDRAPNTRPAEIRGRCASCRCDTLHIFN